MEEIKQWIVEWFESHGGGSNVRSHTADNYFDKGWIDSFMFITFIADLEERFKITFSNEEFQDRSFATIDGLTAIIEKKHG